MNRHDQVESANFRPRIDHVPHILHSVKGSFKLSYLQSITESEAVNKPVWSCVGTLQR